MYFRKGATRAHCQVLAITYGMICRINTRCECQGDQPTTLGATIAYQRWTFDRCNFRYKIAHLFCRSEEVSEGAEIYGIMCDFARYVQSIFDRATERRSQIQKRQWPRCAIATTNRNRA
jgi:hypothetical protein